MSRYARFSGNFEDIAKDIADISASVKATGIAIETNYSWASKVYEAKKQQALQDAIDMLEATIKEMRDLKERGG